jgi:hypothetical protein
MPSGRRSTASRLAKQESSRARRSVRAVWSTKTLQRTGRPSAVASQVRIGAGLFPEVFPIIVGLLVWGGLYLRDGRLRSLIPLRG